MQIQYLLWGETLRYIKLLTLAIVMAFVFTACSGEDRAAEYAQEIRIKYLEADTISLTADITADYGESVYEFKVSFAASDGEYELEIIEPENIRGLRAKTKNGSMKLEYDGAELDTGTILSEGVSPVDALPLALEAWRSGYIIESIIDELDGEASIKTTIIVSEKDDIELITWFSEESFLPIRAEFSVAGQRVIMCGFSDVSI